MCIKLHTLIKLYKLSFFFFVCLLFGFFLLFYFNTSSFCIKEMFFIRGSQKLLLNFYTYKHPVPLLYIRLNDHTIQVLIINFCYLDRVYFFFRPYLCLDVLMPYKFWLPVQVFGDLQKNNRKLCLRLSSLLCFNRIRFSFSQKQINKMI